MLIACSLTHTQRRRCRRHGVPGVRRRRRQGSSAGLPAGLKHIVHSCRCCTHAHRGARTPYPGLLLPTARGWCSGGRRAAPRHQPAADRYRAAALSSPQPAMAQPDCSVFAVEPGGAGQQSAPPWGNGTHKDKAQAAPAKRQRRVRAAAARLWRPQQGAAERLPGVCDVTCAGLRLAHACMRVTWWLVTWFCWYRAGCGCTRSHLSTPPRCRRRCRRCRLPPAAPAA